MRVGAGVGKFKPGDQVFSRPRDGRIGTFAEFIAIDEADVALKPGKLSFAEAASIPLVGLTAWQALVEHAGLKSGQKVIIQAGSGGVGTFAIQRAKHPGADVATTTSAANAELVRNLGADVVIDYRTQDFEKILSDYDVALNSQDTATLEKSLGIIRRGGVAVSISGPPDPAFSSQRHLNPIIGLILRLVSRGIRKKAERMGIRYTFLFMHGSGPQLEQITKLIEADAIRPIIDTAFAFEALNQAMAYRETGRAKGKVVVTLRQEPKTFTTRRGPIQRRRRA